MNTNRFVLILRYLIRSEDSAVTRPEDLSFRTGSVATLKTLLCVVVAFGLSYAMSRLG